MSERSHVLCVADDVYKAAGRLRESLDWIEKLGRAGAPRANSFAKHSLIS